MHDPASLFNYSVALKSQPSHHVAHTRLPALPMHNGQPWWYEEANCMLVASYPRDASKMLYLSLDGWPVTSCMLRLATHAGARRCPR